jgi:hypothetical protein
MAILQNCRTVIATALMLLLMDCRFIGPGSTPLPSIVARLERRVTEQLFTAGCRLFTEPCQL